MVKTKKYYHFTSYENLESISKNGLIPLRGGRTRSIGDKRNAIFLSLDIKNAILMYCSLLHHYNSYAGNNGLKSIEFYKDLIKSYQKSAKRKPLDKEDLAELEAISGAIEWVNQIMEYKDFFEYIGDGVYLTISGITDITVTNPEDCYTSRIIPPEKIKVVLLRNKETGEITDHREQVLTYFLSVTPIDSTLKNVHNIITIKVVKDLYKNRLNDIKYYNSNNFKIEEVPIDLYIAKKKNEEASVKRNNFVPNINRKD